MKDVYYIPEIANKLGKTEAAVRNLIAKRSNSIPPFVRIGGRVCFRVRDYDEWLAGFAIENQTKQRGR